MPERPTAAAESAAPHPSVRAARVELAIIATHSQNMRRSAAHGDSS
jgi:hypothetical protein